MSDQKELHEELAAAREPHTSSARDRTPYAAPRLRHLGSVRELTLGVSGFGNDAVGKKA